jgi:hypothetical protein
MIRLLLITSLLLGSVASAAEQMGIEVGFRSQSGDAVGGTETTGKTGLQGGGFAEFGEKNSKWRLRTGFYYTQRPIEVGGASPGDYTLTYFDLPVQAVYRFEEHAGVFVGPVVSMLLEKKTTISGGSVTGAKSMITPIQVGATFKFMPDIGATLFYETASGELSDQVENYRAVGVNLVFTLD